MTPLLAQRIATMVGEHPESTAIVGASGTVTFADFWTGVERTAATLRGGRRIAVLPTSDVGSLTVVAAAMASGIGVVLLHRHLLAEEMTHVLEVARPAMVVAAPSQHRRLARLGVGEVVTPAALLGSGSSGRTREGGQDSPTPEMELFVGVTSGTTGTPKLFVRNQGSWAATLDRSDALFGIGPGDRVSVPGVLDHTHFLYGALHSLTRGAAVDLRDALTALGDGATHLYSVPTIAWDVARGAATPFPRVREVLSSAARWPRGARDALRSVVPNASIVHFYGASELSFVSYERDSRGDYSGSGGSGNGDSVLFDGVEAEARDGLVYVRSDMLFDGYLTGCASSVSGVSGESSVSGGPVDGWMSVGDRGVVQGNRIKLFGRGSETIIRAGLNVELVPIEEALTAIPGVAEAACIGMPSDRMGEEPCAAVVLSDVVSNDQLTVQDIWRHLRRVLPSPSIPTTVLIVDALPRTPRGKLDRQALGATFATVRTAPSTTNHTVSAPPS